MMGLTADRNGTLTPVFGGALLAALLLLVCGAAVGAAPAATGATRPELAATTLDGKPFDLAAERGRWVIVNFWATWCVPCIKEMPAISGYVAAHPDVTAIGLAWDNSPRAEVAAFAKKHPVDYPLAQVDTSRAPGGFAPPVALPTTYLIAPDGRVVKHFLGPVTVKLLDEAVASAGKEN